MKRLVTCFAIALVLTACRDVVEPTAVGGRPHFSNATPDAWTPIASMAHARYRARAATGVDGRVFVFGGLDPDRRSEPVGAEVYDPATNTWSAIADPGTIYLAAVARGSDNRIYLAGGVYRQAISRDVRAYDPRSNSYTTVSSMRAPRYAAASATGLDGRIYVIGGGDPNSEPTTTGQVYDPATDIWSATAPASIPRYMSAAATGADGRIYVIGGLTNAFGAPTSSVEAYDPATNTWSVVASMPANLAGQAAATGRDGRIYVFGGTDEAGFSSTSVVAYDPSTNSWATVAPLSAARYDLSGAAGLDGRIYAIGGQLDGHITGSSAEALQTNATPADQPPVAAPGGPYSGIVGVAVAFDGSGSSDPDDDAMSFQWSFGDGATLSDGGATPSHSYATAGSYTITLTVSDPAGLTGTSTATVTVLSPAGASQALGSSVQALLSAGVVSGQTASQLMSSINAATNSIANGNPTAATGQLGAFINKVQAAVRNGKVNATDGAALIAFAQRVLSSISS